MGFKRPLQPPDIPPVDSDISIEYRLADLVQSRLASNIERGDKYPLWWALYDAFRREFWIGGACRCVADVLLVAAPYTLRYLIQFVADSYQANRQGVPGPPLSHGIAFLAGIAVMLAIQTLANNHFMFRLGVIGGQARAVLVSSIFDKALRIEGRGGVPPSTEPTDDDAAGGKSGRNGRSGKGKAAASDHSLGRLTNFLSVDCARIDRAAAATHFLWTAPLALCLAVTLRTYPGFRVFQFVRRPRLIQGAFSYPQFMRERSRGPGASSCRLRYAHHCRRHSLPDAEGRGQGNRGAR